MKTSHERVTEALDLLTTGLYPYVERELKAIYKDDWIRNARGKSRKDRDDILPQGDVIRWDAHAVLNVMWDHWNSVFRHKLGHLERSLISELREFRNRWAHQADFEFDDTYRTLDSVHRLLTAVAAPGAEQLAWDKNELLRERIANELDEKSRRSEFNKDRITNSVIYVVSCVSIVYVLLNRVGWEAWPVAGFMVFIFLYLIYKQFAARFPRIGPSECRRCGKIIYGTECPYCVDRPIAIVGREGAAR